MNQHLPVDATGVGKSFGSVLAVDDITVRVAAGEVYGPVYEFDRCFDPNGDNAPTGVAFPSLLGVASTTVMPDAHGDAGLQLTCGSGDRGCAGSVTATAGRTRLGTMPIHLKEESTTTLPLPTALPAGAAEVTFTVHLRTGAGPSSPVTLPVQAS